MAEKSYPYVGSKKITIPDALHNLSFEVLVHYPTTKESKPTSFGPYTMDVCEDGPLPLDKFPLIVISHGNGGSHLLYRTISMYLALQGYIIAMVEHYGNNRNNNTLAYTLENLSYRPRHLRLTINYLIADTFFQNHIQQNKIALIGHSMGGYAALALAGGIPHTEQGVVIDVEHDDRIKAIVLLAPGSGWFKQGLEKVTQPILLVMAEHDPVTPLMNAEVVIEYVPDKTKVAYHIIPNAGHFSFLSPFPPHMRKPDFLPATDPEGFDRDQFHQELPQMIQEFLLNQLY